MTREAKIGLLTGLGVIVLIGVLLSEYLGGPTAGTPGGANRMAPLPVAAAYRERVVSPIGVPGAQRIEGAQVADAGQAAGPVAAAGQTGQGMTPGVPLMNEIGSLPRAYATDSDPAPMDASASAATAVPGQPVMGAPVTPVRDGRVLAMAQANPGVPVFQLDDGAPVAMVSLAKKTQAGAAKPVGEEYVIAPGDTLDKIAKKFYKSAKAEDEQRIVAANPGSLKNVTTMLMAGKKLVIPPAPGAVAVAKAQAKAEAPKSGTPTMVMIHPPGFKAEGATGGKVDATTGDVAKKDAAKKVAGTLYVVQDGDTLEKIAKKCSANNYQAFAKQLGALNNIKDPRSLQVGMKLKLPAKA